MKRKICCMMVIVLLLGMIQIFTEPAMAEIAYGYSTDGFACLQEYRTDRGAKQVLYGNEIAIVGHKDGYMHFIGPSTPSLTIPASVTVGNKTYSVVCVGSTGYADAYGGYAGKRISYLNGLTTVTIQNGVRIIGGDAFSYCHTLKTVTIPSSVTRLHNSAFAGCEELTTVYMPTSVKTIGDWAFNGCNNLTIHYAGTEEEWANVSIGNYNTYKVVFPEKPMPPMYDKYKGYYVVKGTDGNLAINNGPGTSSSGYQQIHRIPEGTKIYISKATGYNGWGKSSGNWGYVTYGGVSGYCAMNFLAPADSTDAGTGSGGGSTTACSCSTSYAGYYIVRGTVGSLAINSGHGTASSGYRQLGTIPEGETIYISAASGYNGRGRSSGNWGHVTYGGVTGYCAMNYLDVTDSTDSCSAANAGYYRVKGTDGSLGLNNGHGYGGSYTQLTAIPEGTIVYVSKMMSGYNGAGHSSGVWGHVSYNGYNGYSSMNYLEFVSKDTTSPTVTNVRYENLTVSGFDVVATVSDDVGVTKVQCPVWTEANGQDDLDTSWPTNTACSATLDGNQARYRVSFSDHNNEKGNYVVHVYAYDAMGQTGLGTMTVSVDTNAPVISSASIQNITPYGYDVIVKATDADTGVAEIRVSTKTNAETKPVIISQQFSAVSSKTSTFHITARATDTAYHTTVTAVDLLGNTSASFAAADAYVDATAPSISSVSITGTDSTGMDVEVTAKDNKKLAEIRLLVWTPDNDAEGESNNGKDMVVTYAKSASGTSKTLSFRVNTAEHDGETYTRYSVAAVAADSCGNVSKQSGTKTAFVDPEPTKFMLPAYLKTIQAEAFSSISAHFVIVGKKCTSIGSKAFASNSKLKLIAIPASVKSISDDAFSSSTHVVILAPIGSYAQTWAEEHGFTWIHWDK